MDVAQACRARGIRNVAVSAGYVCDAPRAELFRHMDAANIDLKGFTEGFYRKLCTGSVQPCNGAVQGCTTSVHPCTGARHRCSRPVHLCTDRAHDCSDPVHDRTGPMHPCTDSMQCCTG